MDLERRVELISRAPAEEVITKDELRALLESERHPIAYNGWEPSGPVHLGTGLMCAYKMKDFAEAGVKFKAYLATWHAWLNNKFDGNLELIKKAALHFKHSWLACGVPESKVEFLFPDKLYDDIDYWAKVVKVAREVTVARVVRTLEIAGRSEDAQESRKVAELIYTPMQVADIFHFGVKLCQLGMDQRKANMVAREVGEKLGYWKPVSVHHHLLQGLGKPPQWPLPPDATERKRMLSSVKMSKSLPQSCIYIYDEPPAIKKKLGTAFCPEREVEFNPVIDIARHIIYRERKNGITIERPAKFGGKLELQTFDELARVYKEGKLHPADLKNAVADELSEILKPVRTYFEKNKGARESKEFILKARITR
ncbi:tyrosine--tRNA ligase [Candidatus Micrarchaeota archaeon]|nr:MAG: tyrosine--tRNA ligase [Candidatus Micrarchaeota archaeon]